MEWVYVMSKVAVTGSGGFIGSHLVRFLTERGHLVSGIEAEDHGGILNKEYLESAMQDCDTVVHLAALLGVRTTDSFEDFFEANLIGSKNVVEASYKAGAKRLIYASSTAVRTLRSDYATTKAIAETLLRGRCRQLGIDFVGLRLFNVYGPGQTSMHGALIPTVFENIKRNRRTVIHESGNQTRDFIYITDVVGCLAAAIETDKSFSGLCIDVGTGWATKVLTLVRMLYEVAGYQPQLNFESFPNDHASKTWGCADTTICRDRLGVANFTSLKEGLAMTYQASLPKKVVRMARSEKTG